MTLPTASRCNVKRSTRRRCRCNASRGSALRRSIVVLGRIPRAVDAKPTTIRAQIDAFLGFYFSREYDDLRL